jgi:CPA2 family monovalent cation:H+ antiporter-2
MHEFLIIRDIIIILLVSLPIIFLFNRINVPSLVGFLVAGMIIGPYGFQLISDVNNIAVMAEVGVILLLFTIGLELSIEKLFLMKKFLLLAGGLQVILTTIFSSLIFYLVGFPLNKSIFFGMLMSVSSTAIILKILYDRDELESPHGKIALSISLFQDLATVPMILLLPILGMASGQTEINIAYQLVFAFVSVFLIVAAARVLMPRILYQLAKLKIKEVFTIGIILLLLGTAYLTHTIGLSFAIGAFVAGLILSESEYSHQIVSEILPFKDVFNSIFFASIGMLVSLNIIADLPVQLILLVIGIILLKFLIVFGIVLVMRYPLRTAIMSGLLLAQIGEFSFVIAQEGAGFNLFPEDLFNVFLASSIFTMLISSFLYQVSPKIVDLFQSAPVMHKPTDKVITSAKYKNHVIIAGFGLNGRNLARVLTETGIKYVVIELNPQTIKHEKKKGENIIFGDVTRKEILQKAGVEAALVLVIAISDPSSSRRALMLAKQTNPHIHVIVRTRYTNEINQLIKLGADEVIPEEFETSLQIFGKVLRKFHIPLNVIMKQISILRSESYSMMVKEELTTHPLVNLNEILAAGLTDTFFVDDDNSFIGKTLSEINLRAKTDATIIAIVRNGKTISNPSGGEIINLHDTLVITGTHQAVDDAFDYLAKGSS